MKNDVEVAKDIILTYLREMNNEKSKEEMLKIREGNKYSLYLHVEILADTFKKAKRELEKQIAKEGQ